MKWTFRRKKLFVDWMSSLRKKEQAQVDARLDRIEEEGHFGSIRNLGDGLWELKFNNGNRIYYARTGETEITLISGGNKNGQDSDIKKAKNLLYE
jgi:putative addiction module killer protein